MTRASFSKNIKKNISKINSKFNVKQFDVLYKHIHVQNENENENYQQFIRGKQIDYYFVIQYFINNYCRFLLGSGRTENILKAFLTMLSK